MIFLGGEAVLYFSKSVTARNTAEQPTACFTRSNEGQIPAQGTSLETLMTFMSVIRWHLSAVYPWTNTSLHRDILRCCLRSLLLTCHSGTPMPNFLFSEQHYPLYPPLWSNYSFRENNRTVVPKRVRSAVVRGAEQTSSFGVSCLSLALLLKQDQHKPTSLAGLTDIAFKSSITSTPERARRGFLCRVCWGEGGCG